MPRLRIHPPGYKDKRRERPEYRILVRLLDPDDMATIRAKAKRDRTSVAEAVRTLLTWGMEVEATYSQSR